MSDLQVSLSFSSIHSGSEAQLNGELSQDFTSSCRSELLNLLQERPLDELVDDNILTSLLVSTDEEIVLLALEALASKTKTHNLVHTEKTSMMTMELSRGWPSLDLLSCVSGESSSSIYSESINPEASSCLEHFNRLVRELQIPAESRFAMLSRIRFARAFESTETRHAYLKIMIMAMQLQWQRHLMLRQLRKLVKSEKHNVPASIRLLALQTLTFYEEGIEVFSPADRQRRVENFLSGKKIESFDSSFVEAMLDDAIIPTTIRGNRSHRELPEFIIRSASEDNVLAWLEKELENVAAADQEIVITLLFSSGILYAGLSERLHLCLLKIFRHSELFGWMVFTAATRVFLFTRRSDSELDSAYMNAVISVAIPFGWEVENEAIPFFFSRLTLMPELEKKTIDLILRDFETHRNSPLLSHALQRQAGFTSSLFKSSSEELIRQLPASKSEFPILNKTATRRLRGDLDSKCFGDPEKLLQDLERMMQLGGGVFLRQLGGQSSKKAVVMKLVAVFEAAAWPLTGVCFSILKQLVDSWGFSDVKPLLDSVVRLHGAGFFLELARKSPYSDSLMLVAWSNAETDQRRLVSASLLDDLSRTGTAAAVITRLVSSREDMALAPGLGSRALKMLRPASPPCSQPTSWLHAALRFSWHQLFGGVSSDSSSPDTRRDLLLILNHILEVLHRGGDNLFVTKQQEDNEEFSSLRRETLAWYVRFLAQAFRGLELSGALELLKLGEFLTRDEEVARELLNTWKVPHLVDKLRELAADDRTSRSYVTRTLIHLLEDDQVLYHSMVYKIRSFIATSEEGYTLEHFLTSLSALAFRNSAVFLQACADSCDLIPDSGLIRMKPGAYQAYRVNSSSPVQQFNSLLGCILSTPNDDALELLTTILVELPVFVQAAIDAGAVERVLESSCISEVAFSNFVEVLERHNKLRSITGPLLTVFSSPELDNNRLINVCKRLPRCWGCVSTLLLEWILKGLSLLDLDHPEAEAAAASVFQTVRRIIDRRVDPVHPPQTFPGPNVSDAIAKGFRSLLQQMPLRGIAEAVQEEEEERVLCEWNATDEQLEVLGKFFWLAPRIAPSTDSQVLLVRLLREDRVVSRASVSRVLLSMLQRPGPARGPGLRTSYSSINGVPEFVLRRVFTFLLSLVSKRFSGSGYCFEEVGFIPLLVAATKLKVLRRLSTELLEAILLQLKRQGKTYSISLSEEELHTLCHLAILTSNRLSNVLVSLVSLDHALSPVFLSCIKALSREIISSALEDLERGDYSSCGPVARLSLVFEGVSDAGAREHLLSSLAPLWSFIHETRITKGRTLVQAFFIAQTLSSDSTPSKQALELLESIAKNHTRLVKLAIPMLRRWPSLKSVGFSTKLDFLRDSFVSCDPLGVRAEVNVRRDHVLLDSYEEFGCFQPELLRVSDNISVNFVGEPGCGGDGLRREWYQILSRAIAKELFTKSGNPRSSSQHDISYFRFAGHLVAKAIVDDERLDVNFSQSFYKHLLGQEVTYQDIGDPILLRNLNWLLESHVDESMGLTFSVDDISSESSKMTSYDLVAGGSNIPVTDVNKHEYVRLLGEYRLRKSFELKLDAFLDGFYEVLPKELISCFLPGELEFIICGDIREINVADLKAVAKCDHEQQILQWFWEVVGSFDNEKKRLLLEFATGSSKVPFGGVRKFVVGHKVMEGLSRSDDYLPIAQTCASLILLPFYITKENLKRKLLQAITEGCGGFQFA